MKIKVCGLKYQDNLNEVASLGVNYIGMIFHEDSPRYAGTVPFTETEQFNGVKKVGVFVNASIEIILNKIKLFSLDFVQLHGNEDPTFCLSLKKHTKIIKAIPVLDSLDVSLLESYSDSIDYFLFDTKTAMHGGSGKKFDWKILNAYSLNKPFFLSGGISLEDTEEIKNIKIPYLYGVDINSKFEIKPGFKNTELVKQFINQLQNEKEAK